MAGNSTAISNFSDFSRENLEELRSEINALLESLRNVEERLQDGRDLVNAAQKLEDEASATQPRKNVLLRWLGFISPGVQAVAGIATDVEKIEHLVNAIT